MNKINPAMILSKIGEYDIAKPSKAEILPPEIKFKNLLINGLSKQLKYIQNDIEGIGQIDSIKRWFKPLENKTGFYCFLKYQNKPIPYLPDESTAVIAKTMHDVKIIYTNLKKEIENNSDFSNYLFEISQKMNIAKGAKKN